MKIFRLTLCSMVCYSSIAYSESPKDLVQQDLARVDCSAGLAAFEAWVYPVLRKECTGCHDRPARAIEAPAFATSNIQHSYEEIKSRMNFESIESSRFVDIGGGPHCNALGPRHNISCTQTKQSLTNISKLWWNDGEINCSKLGKFSSQPMPIPTVLSTDYRNPTKLRFDMSHIVAGSWLEMDIIRFTTATETVKGSYKIFNVRLLSFQESIMFVGLRFLLNNKYDTFANTFAGLSATVSPRPFSSENEVWPFTTVSNESVVLVADDLETENLTLNFENFSVSESPACMAWNQFSENLTKLIKVRDCGLCHSASTTLPESLHQNSFVLFSTDNPDLICQQMIERVNFSEPRRSALYSKLCRRSSGHENLSFRECFQDDFIGGWIEAERDARN